MVDLPGTYSLLATSVDEEVARDFLLFGRPDVTVVVVDACRLERNLNLALQVLEITDRVVVCLNLMDEARRHGLQVDAAQLARELGVPVVPDGGAAERRHRRVAAADRRRGDGPGRLPAAAGGGAPCPLKQVADDLARTVARRFPGLPNARWVALRLLDSDQRIVEAVATGELGDLSRDKVVRRGSGRPAAGHPAPAAPTPPPRVADQGGRTALAGGSRLPPVAGRSDLRPGGGDRRSASSAATRPAAAPTGITGSTGC